MEYKNEQQLLNVIKYALPSLVLLFSLIVTTFLYNKNKTDFESIKKNTEIEFIKQKKILIKEQIENLYDYIIQEQKDTEKNLKKTLIGRVHEAHTIIQNIYKEYQHTHTKKELTLMIRTTLKDIRFNNNRGYFFVYDKKATNIIHPLIPKLEGKNLINYKDTKGTFVLRESISLLKDKDESYQQWYWRKTKGDLREYKKIGFVKNIYELDWFLGTGEYVEDFSIDIQKKVLLQVEKLKFGNNSYFIVTDKNNNYLSHINKDLVGQNALQVLGDMNDSTSLEKIKKVITKKEGYLDLHFFKPDSSKTSLKIIYFKTIPSWGWTISTGFYEDDVDMLIDKEKEILTNNYNKNLNSLLRVTSLFTLILLILSFYISRVIEQKFKSYNDSIKKHIEENKQQHDLLSQKSKLASMGEMMENIAHQWRQPLSVITTASSGIKVYKDMNLLSDEFLEEAISSISSSCHHLSQTIDDFSDFFKPDNVKSEFVLKNSIKKIYGLLSFQFKDYEIEIIENIEDISIMNSERGLLQVLLNILNNAKDALLQCEDTRRYIFIDIYRKDNKVIIKIKDNAKGINKEIIKRVFEPYFTTKYKSQGTGIGLYMSQEIITRHMNGSLSVENTSYAYKGSNFKGALFTIEFPLS
ncbi:MAG: histidine kinase [Arcobacter sp.]|nr:MAG: histidine kinase [Arcobacter sp.]